MTADLIVHRFTAFGGARCEVLAWGIEEADVSAVVAEVYAFESRLSRFQDTSELAQFNARAGSRVAVTPLLEAMLRAALRAYELSEGLVDAGILPALRAAGYDRSIEQVVGVVAASVAPAQRPLPEVLTVGDGWAELRSDAAIDLGGIAKGWLADRLAERLDNAVVNLGGDLRAAGVGPDGAGWPIGLADGRVVSVSDAGVATSGSGRRRWPGGHHIIDPRIGRPALSDISAVSVVAQSAERAEVLAKGALLVGSARASRWLIDHGGLAHAIIRMPEESAADEP